MIDAIPFPDAAVLAAFIAASFALYLTPGADMMFTIGCAASGGPRAGLAAAAGIGLGVLVHVGVAAAGLGALLLAWPGAHDAIRYAGAAYLLWLAVRMWRAEPEPAPARGARALRRAFARGFVTNILNPKVALFVLAFLPQFTSAEAGPIGPQILVLGAILALGGAITDGAIGVAAGAVSGWLRRSARTLNRIASVIFGGLAARLVLD